MTDGDNPVADAWSAETVISILDLVRDGVLVVDASDVIRYANPVAAERLGGRPADVVGHPLFELLAGLEGSSVPSRLAELRRAGGEVEIEEYVPVLRGWFHMVANANAGDITIFFREVTEQLRAERHRRLVSRLDQEVAATATTPDALTAVTHVLRQELGFDLAEMWRRSPSSTELRLVAIDHAADHSDLARFAADAPTSVPATTDGGLPGRAIASDAVVVVPDLAADPGTRSGAAGAELRAGLFGRIDIDRGGSTVIGLMRGAPLATDDAEEVFDQIRPHVASLLSRRRAHVEVEQFFRLSREFIAITGLDGTYRRLNSAMVNGLGYADEAELRAIGPLDMLHPDDRERTVSAIRESFESGRPIDRLENRVRAADGRYRWISWSARAFHGEAIIFATGRDVTEEREERLFRDGQHEVLRGIAAGEPLEQTFARLRELMETQDPSVQCSVVLSASEFDPAAASWTVPVMGPDDEELGTFAVYARDGGGPTSLQLGRVRDLVGLAEVAIERSRGAAALADSEARSRLLAEVVTDAIFEYDVGARRWHTDAFAQLLGHDVVPDGIDDVWWTEHLHPDQRDLILDDRERVLGSDAELWMSEHRIRRADGGDADVMMRGRILRDREGRAVWMIGGMSDVTERRDLERRYLRAQRVESLGTLAGGIAHDLNNSLMPVLMAAELLAEEPLSDDVRETVDVIAVSARRSAEMVRNILTYARGGDGTPSVVDVDDIVRTTSRMMRDTFPKDIRLVVPDRPSGLRVRVDTTQLHQVVMNLALNARDAMPDGGTLTISVGEVDVEPHRSTGTEERPVDLLPGRYARIRIADTGTGITAAVRDRLFEPFFTTKPRAEGTGLGLPTALAIARSHDGGLAVSSEVGIGSTFDLLVPVVADATTIGDRIDAVEPGESLLGENALVLVVDDEPVVRSVVREVLESAGYQVIEAVNGEEGLRLATDRVDVAVVLTDIAMPVMDGLEMVERLRGVGRRVPVVAMTGVADDQRVAALSAAGGAAVLPKPFDRVALLASVADARRQP